MNKESFKVYAVDSGKRLDVCLFDKLNGSYSRSQIKRIIQNKLVFVSGTVRKPNYHVKEGDSVDISFPEKASREITAQDIPIDIIHEDDDIIVINKPAGMVVHPAPGNKDNTLVNALVFHAKGKLARINTSPRPGIVHRLDKDVSGLIVVAKTDFAYTKLVHFFKEKSIKKTYIAFVHGNIANNKGDLELPVGRSLKDRKKMAVGFFNSKDAFTSFNVLKRYTGYTKLRIQISTGRTHQIRVHMSYIGHPIIGDAKYGGRKFKRIALYAAGLEFYHPATGKELSFKVGMPAELTQLDDNTIFDHNDMLQ